MGGNPKTVVQKAPGTESGRMALDLPAAEEISRPKFFWAPEMAGVRRNFGRKWVFAADLKILVKEKIGRGWLWKKEFRSEGISACEGEKVGEESIYRG